MYIFFTLIVYIKWYRLRTVHVVLVYCFLVFAEHMQYFILFMQNRGKHYEISL